MAEMKLTMVADVTSFIAGTQDVEGSLEKVGDALDDVARQAQQDGKDAGKDLARGLDTGADDSVKSVERVEKSFVDLVKASKAESKKVEKNLADSVDDGAHKAADSVGEFKDEARANFAETAASFSGNMDDAASAVQGTLGGLAGSLPGPLGIITGLLGAVGGAWFASMQEAKEKTAALVESLTQDMIESGNRVASETFITEALTAIATESDDAVISLEDLRKEAALTGVDQATLARAHVGDQKAIARTLEVVEAASKKAWDAAHNGAVEQKSYNSQVATGLDTVAAKLTGVSKSTDTAAAHAEFLSDALAQAGPEAEGSAARAGDAFDNLGRRLDDMPATVPLKLDTKDLDDQVRKYKPPRVLLSGELEVRAGQRAV